MSTQQIVRLISLVASGVLAARRFVTIDSSGEAAYPSAQASASGVTQEATTAQGQVVGCAVPDGAIAKVEAGDVITQGADISPDATGRAIPHVAAVGNVKMGKAMEAAGAAGDIISCQILNLGTDGGS